MISSESEGEIKNGSYWFTDGRGANSKIAVQLPQGIAESPMCNDVGVPKSETREGVLESDRETGVRTAVLRV